MAPEALGEMDEAVAKRARAEVSMRPFGRQEEAAAPCSFWLSVFFLACQEAGYLTGFALKIDGGIYYGARINWQRTQKEYG